MLLHTLRRRAVTTALRTAAAPGRGVHATAPAHSGWGSGSPMDAPYQGRNTSKISLGINIVPERTAYVIERLGRFHKVLPPGLNFTIPVIDRIAYSHTLKEVTIPIPGQAAITKDNVQLNIDGVLFAKVVDPVAASYGVADAFYAVSQLAQTTMRSEIGRISLDTTFAERDSLNAAIVAALQEASAAWGLQCMRYEIKDIAAPPGVRAAMELQAEAERRKRADILASEGARESAINVAEGAKARAVLEAQGARESAELRAQGEAAAIRARAAATADGLATVGATLADGRSGGTDAASLRVAEAYVAAFSQLAREGTVTLLPANVGEPAAMVGAAMSIFKGSGGGGGGSGDGGGSSHTTATLPPPPPPPRAKAAPVAPTASAGDRPILSLRTARAG